MGEEGCAKQAARQKKERAPRDPERRKRQIVEAAAELIAQEGTRHLTHRRVAERAGVPLGSTTQYFKSIDDLLRAGLSLLAEQIAQRNQEMLAQMSGRKAGADMLCDFAIAYLEDKQQVNTDAKFYAAAISDPEVGGLWKRALAECAQDYAPFMDAERLQMLSSFLTGLVVEAAIYDTPHNPEVIRAAIVSLIGEGDGK